MTEGNALGGDGTHISPTEVTPKLDKGAQDTWRLSWPYGGRLDKTGVTPRRLRRRGWGQTAMAGVYTDQRLNLSNRWEGLRKKAKVSNRTRETWPSGIIGGLRES